MLFSSLEVIFPLLLAFVVSDVPLLVLFLLLFFVPVLLFLDAEDALPLLWIEATDTPEPLLLLLLFEDWIEPTLLLFPLEEVSSPTFGALLASQ